MYRLILFAFAAAYLLAACNPPVRLSPSNPKTGLDSVYYAGVVEDARSVDLREARYLARVKVGDLGVSLDCGYPDALANATRMARGIGGNLLVITEHKQNQSKSRCHRIKAEIYRVASLEGLESWLYWHPARPLQAGDLRGKPAAGSSGLAPVQVELRCRIGGDYFKSAIVRTETLFWADSTWSMAGTPGERIALRRAQLYFDLAELHARQLKSELAGLGPDLPALTGRFRELLSVQQGALQSDCRTLEDELDVADPAPVLARWEADVRSRLAALEQFGGDWVVDLRKKHKG